MLKQTSMMRGCLVVSLDFELMWGVRDSCSPEDYGQTNVKQVEYVITRMLKMFRTYHIHATFATVGFIFCKNKMQALESIPEKRPSYANESLSPYKHYIENIEDRYNELYFAPRIINQLKQHPNIEIATHTFSHYYCTENGQTIEQFDHDLSQACKIATANEIQLHSIVFPRNQVNDEYLQICSNHGLIVYRGNAKKYYNETSTTVAALKQRFSRLVDTYINLGGYSVANYLELKSTHGVMNIPGTRFIRPYSPKLKYLETLRMHRIKKEMEYAAKNNCLYHIWWHPHNFGNHIEENFHFLEQILQHYTYCHKQYQMQSYNMKEVADLLNK